MPYWLVCHWLGFTKDLTLLSASIEVEISGISPALIWIYYTCSALKTYLLLTEGQLTLSLHRGTKTFIISKRSDYITVCSFILTPRAASLHSADKSRDRLSLCAILFACSLFKHVGFVERQYLQSVLAVVLFFCPWMDCQGELRWGDKHTGCSNSWEEPTICASLCFTLLYAW